MTLPRPLTATRFRLQFCLQWRVLRSQIWRTATSVDSNTQSEARITSDASTDMTGWRYQPLPHGL